MRNPLTQKVNFFISIAFIISFGFFLTITVVQALNANAPLWDRLTTPIELEN